MQKLVILMLQLNRILNLSLLILYIMLNHNLIIMRFLPSYLFSYIMVYTIMYILDHSRNLMNIILMLHTIILLLLLKSMLYVLQLSLLYYNQLHLIIIKFNSVVNILQYFLIYLYLNHIYTLLHFIIHLDYILHYRVLHFLFGQIFIIFVQIIFTIILVPNQIIFIINLSYQLMTIYPLSYLSLIFQ